MYVCMYAMGMVPRIGCTTSLESNYHARYLCFPAPPCGVGWVQTDEHENRIQKKLGIEFKEEFNLNLIPMCLFFIWPSSRN